MKRGNIFGIQSKQPGALQTMVNQLIRILNKPSVIQTDIQIEVKYAQFKYFSPPQYYQVMSRSSDAKEKQKLVMMAGMIQRQRYYFKDSLKKMSHQNMVCLNSLGREVYQLNSCFDEQRHKKFYHMREYLQRQCQFNNQFKSKNILLPQSPKNIYHQYSLIGDNLQFQMQCANQIRLDVIYKDPSSEMYGRYSYSTVTKSWVKTKKTQLIKEQIDIMLSEKSFRFAVNHEDETEVCFQDLQLLREELLKRMFKQVDIRLKRTMRCTRSNMVEYSLSEVYQPNKLQGNYPLFEDLQQYITQDPNVLDTYLLQKFQHFYTYHPPQQIQDATKSQFRHEVECQFTKEGMRQLKQWVGKGQHRQLHYELEQTIQSLYNLFFADHSVRTQEAPWMDKIITSKRQDSGPHIVYPGQRLVNEFGFYMHNVLYEEMTFTKEQQRTELRTESREEKSIFE